MKQLIVLGVLLGFLASCAMGPNYVVPSQVLQAKRWASPNKSRAGLLTRQADRRWWNRFNDPLLSKYIRLASERNLDVQISLQRLLQSRALRASVHAQGGPRITGNVAVTSEHVSRNGRILGSFRDPNRLLKITDIPLTREVYNPGFDAVWELDVFGQLKRQDEEQSAKTQAAVAEVGDSLRQIRAELARSYFDLRANQQRAAIVSHTIALQKEALQLVNEQTTAGAVNQGRLEVMQSQLQTFKAQLPALQAQNWAIAVQIAILLGQEPGNVWPQLVAPKPLASIPQNIAVGMPSDLLRRRPDIAKAERDIAAATAQVGVNVADLYPKFNLVANAALESLSPNTLWRSQSVTSLLGPFMQWSIFQSGRIRANISRSEAALQASILQYKKTILAALGETETALNGFIHAQRSSLASQAALRANQRNEQLAQQRFKEGEDNKLAFINAKQARLSAQSAVVDARHHALIQLVHLYKAVGGEWSNQDRSKAG